MKVSFEVDTPKEYEKLSKLMTELGISKGGGQFKFGVKEYNECLRNQEVIPYLEGYKIFLAPFTRHHLETRRYKRWLNSLEITSNLGMLEYLMPVSFQQLESYYLSNAFSGHSILFAIHEKDTDDFVGTAKIGHIDWLSRCAEFGRVIGEKDARGKGYGTEVIKLILEYCFRVLNLNKVVAGTNADNIAALKTYEKFNFKIEGTIRKSWFKNGKLIDTVRVGLLRDEWQA